DLPSFVAQAGLAELGHELRPAVGGDGAGCVGDRAERAGVGEGPVALVELPGDRRAAVQADVEGFQRAGAAEHARGGGGVGCAAVGGQPAMPEVRAGGGRVQADLARTGGEGPAGQPALEAEGVVVEVEAALLDVEDVAAALVAVGEQDAPVARPVV